MKTNIHFWSYLAEFFLEWEVFQKKIVQEMKTHISYSITFVKKKTSAVHEIMWKNFV